MARRKIAAISLFLSFILLGALLASRNPSERVRPNGKSPVGDDIAPVRVVLITLDTLRYDDLGSDDATSMPRLAKRAKRALRWTRFYAASGLTQPSHASMFTGLQPWVHGITRNGLALRKDVPSVVEALQEQGFSTRAVVASFPLASRFGFHRGFDEFEEEFDRSLGAHGDATWERDWAVPGGEFFAMADVITEQALRALERAHEPRQFFWFHYFDAHAPYGTSVGESVLASDVLSAARMGSGAMSKALARARELRRADLSYLDASLDRLLAAIEKSSGQIETHVFIVSDHGESLGEGGAMGHGRRLTPEQLHVPALLLSPTVLAGERNSVAGSVDVARTLLGLSGELPVPPGMGGRDLRIPAKPGGQAYAMRRTFADGSGTEAKLDGSVARLEGNLFCAIDERGRIFRGNGLLMVEGDGPVAPEKERALVARFSLFEAALDRTARMRHQSPLDEETTRGLRALGYID